MAKRKFTDAVLIVHPECRPEVIDLADEVLSTGGMVEFAKKTDRKTILIGTEEGLINRIRKENPEKQIFPAGNPKICTNMKLTTLKDVYSALKEEKYEITVPQDIMIRAKKAIERMLEYV